MTESMREIYEKALKLPSEERQELVKLLDASTKQDAVLSPAWIEEIGRRIKSIEDGTAGPGIPWRKALAHARRESERRHKERERAKKKPKKR